MKNLFFVLFVISAMLVNAQVREELTKEQWEQQMSANSAKISSLGTEVGSLQKDVDQLKANSAKLIVGDCNTEMLKLVGATTADVDAYRKAVSELEGKIRRKEGPVADRQKDLDALKANLISALPEFFDRVHAQLQKSLDEWAAEEARAAVEVKSKDINYSVVKGDCLWLIAKKKEHYGNGFAWPKIFQANKDQIKNPNLIYPKQVFKIPALTDDEKAKFEKLRKNYKPAPAK